MRLFTTLAAARQLGVSKQTLLNWLYAGKVPEPPRSKKGHRLWSASRVALVKRLVHEGRVHRRTIVHREPGGHPEVVVELAREVCQFLRDGHIDLELFLREVLRHDPTLDAKGHFKRLQTARSKAD